MASKPEIFQLQLRADRIDRAIDKLADSAHVCGSLPDNPTSEALSMQSAVKESLDNSRNRLTSIIHMIV